MNRGFKFYALLIVGLFLSLGTNGQSVAVKTNLLYDATATINAGVEMDIGFFWELQ